MLDLDLIFGDADGRPGLQPPAALTTAGSGPQDAPADSDADAGPAGGRPDLQPQDIGSDPAGWLDVTTPDGRRRIVRADAAELEAIDIPPPCPSCGGIVFWWDIGGGRHCEACSPRTAGPRLRELARRLRERYSPKKRTRGLPQDAGNDPAMTVESRT